MDVVVTGTNFVAGGTISLVGSETYIGDTTFVDGATLHVTIYGPADPPGPTAEKVAVVYSGPNGTAELADGFEWTAVAP